MESLRVEKKETNPKKEKTAKPTVEVKFPIEGKMNKYEFIHVGRQVLAALGWPEHEDVNLSIAVEGGAFIARKKT